jgi:hypothetical protein
MLSKIVKKIKNLWLGYQYNKLARVNSFRPENALIISGDPRGGTTWLAQLIKQLPDTALLWEPLMIAKVPEVKAIGFQWRQYIPEDDQWPEAKTIFNKLFSGQLLSPYLCQVTSPDEITHARKILIKFCRANQILPWLTSEFNFRFAPIYLTRHPCAVVASQLRQGGWADIKPSFEIPQGRYQGFYSKHAEFLSRIDTVEKRLTAIWCLCNQVPLTHAENNKRWITITYEALLLDTPQQLNRIEKRWDVKFPSQVYQKADSVSFTTVGGSPVVQGKIKEQLSYWRKQLSQRQIDDILAVLDYFKVDLYNADELPARSFIN